MVPKFLTPRFIAFALAAVLSGCGPIPAEELKLLKIPYTCQSFLSSVDDNDVHAVSLLLDAGMNPNVDCYWAGSGYRGLTRAVFQGHVEMIKLLIKRGADVNYRDTLNPSGRRRRPLDVALMMPGQQRNDEIVKILVRAGGVSAQNDAHAK